VAVLLHFEPRFDSPTAEPDRAPTHGPDMGPTVPDSPDSPDRCQSTVPTCPDSTLPQKLDSDHACILSSTVKLSSTLPATRQLATDSPTARQCPTVPDSARQLDSARTVPESRYRVYETIDPGHQTTTCIAMLRGVCSQTLSKGTNQNSNGGEILARYDLQRACTNVGKTSICEQRESRDSTASTTKVIITCHHEHFRSKSPKGPPSTPGLSIMEQV
jgi:hypothetical protein